MAAGAQLRVDGIQILVQEPAAARVCGPVSPGSVELAVGPPLAGRAALYGQIRPFLCLSGGRT